MPPLAGERWWRQPPKGECISSPAGRLYGFRRQRRYKKWRRRRRTSPAQRYYITPEGESPGPACKAKPITGRTLGAQGQRPGGAINPRPRKRASTFGNTASRRQCLKVPQSFAAALALRQSSTSFLPKSPCSCSNLATTGAVASCHRWISSFGIT